MEEILTLPGRGAKNRQRRAGPAYGIASGVVVDTHVLRLSKPPGFCREMEDPKKVETGFDEDHSAEQMDPIFPPADLARTPNLPRAQRNASNATWSCCATRRTKTV